MRIAADKRRRIRQPHLCQQFDNTIRKLAGGKVTVKPQRLGKLPANPHRWRE